MPSDNLQLFCNSSSRLRVCCMHTQQEPLHKATGGLLVHNYYNRNNMVGANIMCRLNMQWLCGLWGSDHRRQWSSNKMKSQAGGWCKHKKCTKGCTVSLHLWWVYPDRGLRCPLGTAFGKVLPLTNDTMTKHLPPDTECTGFVVVGPSWL